MRFLRALFAACLLAIGGGLAPPPAQASSKSLLDDLRRAMLGRPIGSIVSIHTVGSMQSLGIPGRAQEWDDVRGARFTVDQNAGPLSGASGWDGKVAWSQDYAGLVTIDGGAAGRLQAIDQAYLDNLRYLRADAGGAVVIYAGQRSAENRQYDVLAVTPPQGSELDLWVDPRTHLIARVTATIGIVSTTTVFSNYRRVDGVVYPFAASTQTSTGNSFSERVSGVEFNSDVAERMRVPGRSVHDCSIAGGATTNAPLAIVNNHVYVGVTIDGHGPYRFVLDSGGDYIVTPEVAAALHARIIGGVRLSGVGSATEGAAFTRVDTIAVGTAQVRNPYLLVLPIATGFGVAEGMRIDGMLGYQFLSRFLATVDYANAKLTLAMPAPAPEQSQGAAAIPFFFNGTIPNIPIVVNGVATTAEADTGNRAGLELLAPFLASHAAISALAKTAPAVTGFGVGGPSYARLGRVPSLQIGPYSLSNVVTSFSVETAGALADPFTPANIGGAVWRRFDLTFDYPHERLLLAKGALFDQPVPYDRSGLFLIDSGGTHTVLSVVPASPGAAAGLAKGDVVLAVNGAPAANLSLAALRELLSGPPGTVVRLHVRGPRGAERDASLTLADYV
ncbi:MAG: aspartyl protease family protein [Candidatus Eremiobacteraeota bacterium]|nr:aspartyl protease family protein [Candidatus Eremiobacteraeota bacterium]MBV8499359.1 aspartyl protease family protein [Candidatus Eremiobacteraeota bacterium]